jgi:hypothetical protein
MPVSTETRCLSAASLSPSSSRFCNHRKHVRRDSRALHDLRSRFPFRSDCFRGTRGFAHLQRRRIREPSGCVHWRLRRRQIASKSRSPARQTALPERMRGRDDTL